MDERGAAASTEWIREAGIVLRPWSEADVPTMVELFDTAEMRRRTALPRPYTASVASAQVELSNTGPRQGIYHYAITADGGEPVGLVVLFPRGPGVCEITYAVGARHRGRGHAPRALAALLPFARRLGYTKAVLTIAEDNVPSIKTAEDAGFVRSDLPLGDGYGKGYILDVGVWVRDL